MTCYKNGEQALADFETFEFTMAQHTEQHRKIFNNPFSSNATSNVDVIDWHIIFLLLLRPIMCDFLKIKNRKQKTENKNKL